MEVLSDSTEEYDRGEKMRLYRDVEVAEYWLVDWRKRQVEIYILSPDESSVDHAEYRLIRTITEENKKELQLYMFPSVRIDFEQLFADLD